MLMPDEYSVLSQMRILDREVFYYLEQRMDRETGVIGKKVKVSYGGIALDISERMSPGRRDALLVFTSKQIEHAVGRLVSEGLLKRLESVRDRRQLVVVRIFFAEYLFRHKSAKKQVGSGLVEGGDEYLLDNSIEIKDIITNGNSMSCVNLDEVGTTIYISSSTTKPEDRFSMNLEWSPTESDLRAILFRAVGSKHKLEDIDPAWLANFVAYWSGQGGRQMTQQQWTAKFAGDVVRYFRDPAFVAAKFGSGSQGAGAGQAQPSNGKAMPDWARLPRGDDELSAWAVKHGYGDAFMGESYKDFRDRLRGLINRRLRSNNLAKVVY